MSNIIMWLLWLTFIGLSICDAWKCPQCRNETVIRYNERQSVDSKTTFSFTTHNNGDILYDLWFMYDQSYSFQDEGDGQIDLNLDIKTASMTLNDSSLPQQGVTLIGKQYNSSIKTKINLLCPSDTNIAVSTHHIFNAYKLHSEHEIDLFTPLACPSQCISYNDQTNEYQQCNGHGICSFHPFILQTHCLCEIGYNSSFQCAASSNSSRRRLEELPTAGMTLILEQHNRFRTLVASGEYVYDFVDRKKEGEIIKKTLPAAAPRAMNQLRWDHNLERQASEWADKLKTHSADKGAFSTKWHSNHHIGDPKWGGYDPRITSYGENIYKTGVSGVVTESNVIEACERTKEWWEEELLWYLYGSYTESKEIALGMQIGHLTQAMWGDTATIGCGYSHFGGDIYIICQYSPPGNYMHREPYKTSSATDEIRPKTKPMVSASAASKAKAKKTKAKKTKPMVSASAALKAKKAKTAMDIQSFIRFLVQDPTDNGFVGTSMTEKQFVQYCQDNGFRTTFTEDQLQDLFSVVVSKIKKRSGLKIKSAIRIVILWKYFRKLTEDEVQRILVKHAAVEAYDNYYNDNSFYEDGRVDKSLSDNIYPYFYTQFVAFNFIQITLQTLILSLLFCVCSAIIMFFISKLSKK